MKTVNNVIKVYPVKLRNKLSLLNHVLVFRKNHFGFYTNDFRILKNVHSDDIKNLYVYNLKTMDKKKPSSRIRKKRGKEIQYLDSWYTCPEDCIVQIEYNNNSYKFYKSKKIDGKVIWYQTDKIITIAFLTDNKIQYNSLKKYLKRKYSNLNIIIKYFDEGLSALYFILSSNIKIVITKNNITNISAKHIIKRVRKSNNNVKFIIFDSTEKYEIPDVFFIQNNFLKLLEKIDDLIV